MSSVKANVVDKTTITQLPWWMISVNPHLNIWSLLHLNATLGEEGHCCSYETHTISEEDDKHSSHQVIFHIQQWNHEIVLIKYLMHVLKKEYNITRRTCQQNYSVELRWTEWWSLKPIEPNMSIHKKLISTLKVRSGSGETALSSESEDTGTHRVGHRHPQSRTPAPRE